MRDEKAGKGMFLVEQAEHLMLLNQHGLYWVAIAVAVPMRIGCPARHPLAKEVTRAQNRDHRFFANSVYDG